MSRIPVCALSIVAAIGIAAIPAFGQAVISTRSGLVHYFEGTVTVAGQPLEAHLGKFTSIPVGGELRTGQGKAEVLLTPGVFLRVGENSAVRVLANALSDTRVELIAGSAIIDSQETDAGTSVTLLYKGWSLHQAQKGIYRVDCDPPQLRVREGEVDATPGSGDARVQVERGRELPLTAAAGGEQAAEESRDALGDWQDGRADAITADNAIAANIQDPASFPGLDLPMDGFTYFPMLPFSSLGSSVAGIYEPSGSNPYGVSGVSIYQPGFYSIYLPGYTRRPLGLGLPGGLHRTIYPPPRTGVYRAPPRGPLPHPVTPVRPGGIHVVRR